MIHHGDLFDVLPTLPAQSVHACVTDPPYGIGFMGKEWDTFKPGVAETRIVDNKAIESDNPNLRGRSRGPASSPSAVEYNRSLSGQRGFQEWTERWAREVFRVLRPGAHLLVCGAPRSYHRMASGLEDAGFEVRDSLCWLFGSGFPKSLNVGNGIGTALKPAYEPIVLARRPLLSTVQKNIEQFMCGGLRIDDCRVGTTKDVPASPSQNAGSRIYGKFAPKDGSESGYNPNIGRWPSNVLLDEDAAAALDEQSGELSSGFMAAGTIRTQHESVAMGRMTDNACNRDTYADRGGASRFFYVAKPSRAERDRGCNDGTTQQRDDSRTVGDPGGDNPRNRGAAQRANFHPTVKPVELMRYLVRLVTPKGGTVLDPFTGSGTTGMACQYEGLSFIGIEREAEYVAIAERRIADCLPLLAVEVSA